MSTLNGACDPPKQLQPLRLRTAICDVPLGGLRAADEARKRGPVPQMWLSSWENGGKSKKIWQNEIFNLGLVAFSDIFGHGQWGAQCRPKTRCCPKCVDCVASNQHAARQDELAAVLSWGHA